MSSEIGSYVTTSTVLSTVLVIPLLWYALSRKKPKHDLPLPPGPKPYPIIGNILDFPASNFCETWCKWQRDYGDIVHVDLLGKPVIVLNSLEMTEELLGKRAGKYSGRPRGRMMIDIMGYDWNAAAIFPGPAHSGVRRIFKESIGPQSAHKYDYLIEKEAENLVRRIQHVQGSPIDAIMNIVGAVIITVAYGPGVFEEHGHELIKLNHEAQMDLIWMGTQLWMVEIIPSLQYIPEWTPGAFFKKFGAKGRAMQEKVHWWPWNEVNARYKEGTSGPCVAVEFIEKGRELKLVQDAVGMMYSAGSDTTTTLIVNFLYTMMVHPHIQKKVQSELDSFIGGSRLPTIKDRPNLPYTDAAWKEGVRWAPVTPMAIPHEVTEDDIYKGMYIPKDAMVFLNVRRMLRDPSVFASADEYMPERWLQSHNPKAKDLPDVMNPSFGFGNRSCAGRYLAERVGFAFAMSILIAYDVVPVPGESIPDPSKTVFQDGIVSPPAGFKCSFKPRSGISNALLAQ
ncbi:cytochrome P450 [Serendipita vermifera]|nr:cytochrome P450 [Serendipita vermifera]